MLSKLNVVTIGTVIALVMTLTVLANTPILEREALTVTRTVNQTTNATPTLSTETVTQTVTQPVTKTSVETVTTTVTNTIDQSTTRTVSTQTPLQKLSVEVAFPALSFSRMVYITHPGDGTDRLFLVLQRGRILVFPNIENVTSPTVFLDIVEKVNSSGNEEGLLGLAFDPNYDDNGYFYVYYSAFPPRRSVISRFSVNSNNPNLADSNSELIILEIAQPFSNHNGGNIIFGPDGYLYIGLGDGGGAGDPQRHGQNRSTLLGSILRIDVSNSSTNVRYRIPPDNPFSGLPGLRGEIWAYGLRNPWRFSFDPLTGLLWAADVGQDSFEEVDIIRKGGNYGWNILEGSHCFPPSVLNCNKAGFEMPTVEYTQEDGCSVTGGYVYRGNELMSLYGGYVYGDFCSGKIWALRFDGSGVTEHIQIIDSDLQISSFGIDVDNELYILSFDGRIYRFKPIS